MPSATGVTRVGLITLTAFFVVYCSPDVQPPEDVSKLSDSPGIRAEGDTSTVEWIEVYFNMPSDHSVAFEGNESNDQYDLINSLTALIDSADYSVDLTAYDLQNHRVADALIRAKERGVRVRVITDYNNRDRREAHQNMWDALGEAGIITVDDSGTIYWPDGEIYRQELPNRGAHMHHKFAVIDKKSEDPDDYYVWTGTMNLTYTGPYNTNLTMVIKDNEVARAYREEFEMMWGSAERKPDPGQMRFHREKTNVTQNKFWVGDTKVEVYFGPMDINETKPGISDRIVELIANHARYDARFLAFAITPNIPISQNLWNKSAQTDMRLEGVIDNMFFGRYRNNNDIWAQPEATERNRLILPSRELRKQHQKTLVLDAVRPDYDDGHHAVAITGSYNFSAAAERVNDENIVLIHCDTIANQFYQDFMGVQARAKGEMEPPAPPVSTEEWYTVSNIVDGQVFEIELFPGFQYSVSPLGVRVPRIYAGNDSSHYHGAEARDQLKELVEGKKVKVRAAGAGRAPENRFNRFHAYITVKDDQGKKFSLNRKLLEGGAGTFSDFLAQHPDSVMVYRQIEEQARDQQKGIWENPDRLFERLPRTEVLGEEAEPEPDFPININAAGEHELTALPQIGPARASSIIEYRDQHGPFLVPEDIKNVHGIGGGILEAIRSKIVLDDTEI